MPLKNKLFGNKAFYARVMAVAFPIMVQNGITNFVSMLDNIMVGRLGTSAMSGVSIVNQLLFVYMCCIFGGLSGIGIFTAQYYGKGDEDGVRYTFRLQIIAALLLTLIGVAVFVSGEHTLISLYLHQDASAGTAADIAATLDQAKLYLRVMYIGLLPFALSQVYAGTLRSTGETFSPMIAGIIAVFVNLIGNYILIYGKFGAPALGVAGAAAATVISRFVEAAYLLIWTRIHINEHAYIKRAYRHLLRIPSALTRQVLLKGAPLMLNELFWSGGQAVLLQCYSVRGLTGVAAFNITQTMINVFNITFIAMGNAIAIIIGQMLGAGEIERAKRDAVRMTVFSVLLCIAASSVLMLCSDLFPRVYNTSDQVRSLAGALIRVSALCLPLHAYMNASYFTIRSGGKTLITFLFDGGYCWLVSIPLAWTLAHLTGIDLVWMYLCVQLIDIIKCVIGFFMVRSGIWAQNLTEII